MKKYTIYAIETLKGTIIYVGQTTQKVEYRYNKHLKMKKLNPNKHKLTVLHETHDREVSDELETFYIKKFNTVQKGLNITLGRGAKGLKNPNGCFTSEEQYKKVLCIETGKVYKSAKECADEMGLLRSGISMVCNGKRKTHKGYTFKFV